MIMKKAKCLQTLLFTLMMAMLLAVPALAAGPIDTTAHAGLNIDYKIQASDGTTTPLAGATFHLHKVADVDSTGALTPTTDFTGLLTIYTGGGHDADWQAQATTLEGIIQRDQIPETDGGQTAANGLLNLPTAGKTLTPGLYLLTGDRLVQNGWRYDATPVFIMLPTATANDTWAYTTTCTPKYAASTSGGGGGGSTSRKVQKIWQDTDHQEQRPNEVTVQLLRDGKVYETITLSAANNWRYTWAKLNDSHKWTLTETAVPGYTTTVTQEGTTFVVTNTYPTDDTPGGGDDDDGDDDGGDDNNGGNTPPEDNNEGGNNTLTPPTTPNTPEISNDVPTLPQTGQLWWPVPIMLLAGLALIALGLMRRGRSYEK